MLIHTIMFQLVLDALQTRHQTDTMAPPVPTGVSLEVDMATPSQTPVSLAEDEVTPHVDTAIVDTMEPCDQITHTSTCRNKSASRFRHAKIQVKTKVKMKCKLLKSFLYNLLNFS